MMHNGITSFTQEFNETLHEGWKRFNSIPNRFPHHDFEEAQLIHSFLNDVSQYIYQIIMSSVGGDIGLKYIKEMLE